MSEFKPMIKMMTDEPSVILKLKKGGHVHSKKEHKEEHGHKSMHMAMGGMPGMMPPMMRKRGPMIAPRPMPAAMPGRAMPGAMAAPMMKKGGKMHHKAEGGHMESGKEHKAEMHEMRKIEKELKHHESMKAGKAHHGLKHGGKVHHKAKGGAMLGKELDSYESRDAIKGNEGKFLQTKMVTAKKDTTHGTGGIKEKNAGGYKRGGHVMHHAGGGKVHHVSGHPEGTEAHHKAMAKHHAAKHKEGGSAHHHKMHEHHKHLAKMCKGGSYKDGGTVPESRAKAFENTMMHDGEHHDTVHGTGGIKEKNAGGYKHGGKVHHKKEGGHMDWENRPASGTPPGKTMGKTGEVREANAGGYKHGGHAAKKHHYAHGGMVDSGKAEKMPKKAKSEPVSISRLSGTFKKGGHAKKHSMF